MAFMNSKHRYIFWGTISLMAIMIGFIFFDLFHSPLKQNDFQTLFPNYVGRGNLVKHVDLVKLSLHGESLDIYKYQLSTPAVISCQYPRFDNAPNEINFDSDSVQCWRKCPINSEYLKKDIYSIVRQGNRKWLDEITQSLTNPANYYSYAFADSSTFDFFLYCPSAQLLYYIKCDI